MCSFQSLLDLDPHRFNRWLADMDWSARTRNAARSALLGLTSWAADYGRIPYNPLPSKLIPKHDEDVDRRRLSRALSKEEFQWLINFLLEPGPCGSRLGHEGPLRAIYYLVGATTGLRWKEIARLTWDMIEFDHPSGPTIIVPAGQYGQRLTKNKKCAELPLTSDLAKVLLQLKSQQCPESSRLFHTEPRIQTWRRDLERARAKWIRDATSVEERKLRAKTTFLAYRDERGRTSRPEMPEDELCDVAKRSGRRCARCPAADTPQ